MKFTAVDLFAGCGGLSEGLKQAGFNIIAGIESEKNPARTYKLNHPETVLFQKDIRQFDTKKIKNILKTKPLYLLAGCPPCQGFSSIRRKNKKTPIQDKRNDLILEFYRFIKELKPLTIMMENVPGLVNYKLFKSVITKLKKLKYNIDYKVVDISGFGVPQRRKRLVLLGSVIGKIKVAQGNNTLITVRNTIENLADVNDTEDFVHKIYPKHRPRIKKMISQIPKNGGSRKDLPEKYLLKCHKKKNVGFNDVYGRLRWDDVSSTITGGCLNPSKGRFLHPEKNRCITAREATLLQTFPKNYKFPKDITKTALALMIGNALPPRFSKIQAESINLHIQEHFNSGPI